MELNITSIILAIIGFLSTGGGIGYVITLKSVKKKASAEAMTAVQDVYQETITDLREDKKILKEENAILRERLSLYEKQLQQISEDVARLKNAEASLKYKIEKQGCGKKGCKQRIPIE